MNIKELIEQLEKIENKEANINILVNFKEPENEKFDIHLNSFEIWEDCEDSITLFAYEFSK